PSTKQRFITLVRNNGYALKRHVARYGPIYLLAYFVPLTLTLGQANKAQLHRCVECDITAAVCTCSVIERVRHLRARGFIGRVVSDVRRRPARRRRSRRIGAFVSGYMDGPILAAQSCLPTAPKTISQRLPRRRRCCH